MEKIAKLCKWTKKLTSSPDLAQPLIRNITSATKSSQFELRHIFWLVAPEGDDNQTALFFVRAGKRWGGGGHTPFPRPQETTGNPVLITFGRENDKERRVRNRIEIWKLVSLRCANSNNSEIRQLLLFLYRWLRTKARRRTLKPLTKQHPCSYHVIRESGFSEYDNNSVSNRHGHQPASHNTRLHADGSLKEREIENKLSGDL